MTRVFGSKNAPNQRVSESLDYEPVQNKIFYERMRQAKKERHLFGWAAQQLRSHDSGEVGGQHTAATCPPAASLHTATGTRATPWPSSSSPWCQAC